MLLVVLVVHGVVGHVASSLNCVIGLSTLLVLICHVVSGSISSSCC